MSTERERIHRKVWEMFMNGHSTAEICRKLGKYPVYVDNVINKCREEQRRIYKEYSEPEETPNYCSPQFVLMTNNPKVRALAKKLGFI